MASQEKRKPHSTCPPRIPMEIVVDEEFAKEIAANSNICPMYEKGMYEHAFKRHYSLLRNENLKCEWLEYKKHLASRVIAPFQFPDQRDLHFYKCMIRFVPSETVCKRPSFRKTLMPGPGVDYGGQMPIPYELMMKRNITLKDNNGNAKKRSSLKSADKKKKVTNKKNEKASEKNNE